MKGKTHLNQVLNDAQQDPNSKARAQKQRKPNAKLISYAPIMLKILKKYSFVISHHIKDELIHEFIMEVEKE